MNAEHRNHDDHRITEGPLARGVFLFGLPMVLAMTFHGVFNLVDAWFIGQLPDNQVPLAALTICDPILMVATIFANGVSTASVAMISRARGAGDFRRVRVLSGQSLILVALVSAVFGVCGALLAWPIGSVMGAKGDVLELTADYLVLMFAGVFTIILLLQLTAVLRAAGNPRGPAIVLIFANVLNIVADPFLIDADQLLGITGLPGFGLMGAGYATVGARFAGCVLAYWLCLRARPSVMPMRGEWRPDWTILRQIAVLGAPNTVQLVARVTAIAALIGLVTAEFTTEADPSLTAAVGIGVRIDMVILFGAMGWGAAASTFVGQNLGAGKPDRAEKAAWMAVAAGVLTMLLATGAVVLWAEELVGWFAKGQPSIVAHGTTYLRHLAPSYAFAAAGVVLALALNGAGSMRAPAWIDGLVYVLLLCPVAFASVHFFEGGPTAVWLALAVSNGLLAGLYAVWFRMGRWRTIEL